MLHEGRLPVEEKASLAEAYINGELGVTAVREKFGIDRRTLREWVRLYEHAECSHENGSDILKCEHLKVHDFLRLGVAYC